MGTKLQMYLPKKTFLLILSLVWMEALDYMEAFVEEPSSISMDKVLTKKGLKIIWFLWETIHVL